MTKKELMEMLAGVDDDAVLTFVTKGYDRDGFPFERDADITRVLGGEVVEVRGEYGCTTLEAKTDDIVWIPKYNMYGIDIGYYTKK